MPTIETNARIVRQERVLGHLVLDAGAEDRTLRSLVAQGAQIRCAERALPDEQFVSDTPLRQAARLAFLALRQTQREPANGVPGGHWGRVLRSP